MLDRDFLMAGFSGVVFSSAKKQNTVKVLNHYSSFHFSVVKRKPKKLIWPIKTDADNQMNQSELEANTRSRRQARENACEQLATRFYY